METVSPISRLQKRERIDERDTVLSHHFRVARHLLVVLLGEPVVDAVLWPGDQSDRVNARPVGERADLLNISLDLPQLLDGPLVGFLSHLRSLFHPRGLVVPSEGLVPPLAINVVARPGDVYVEPFRVTWSMLLDQGLNSIIDVPQSLAPQHRHFDSRASVLILECRLKFIPEGTLLGHPGAVHLHQGQRAVAHNNGEGFLHWQRRDSLQRGGEQSTQQANALGEESVLTQPFR